MAVRITSMSSCICFSTKGLRDARSKRRGFELGRVERHAELVVSRLKASDRSQLLVVRLARRSALDGDLDATPFVGQSGISAPCVLAAPEAFESAPGLKVTCERRVQTTDARTDVHDGAVDLADHVHAR